MSFVKCKTIEIISGSSFDKLPPISSQEVPLLNSCLCVVMVHTVLGRCGVWKVTEGLGPGRRSPTAATFPVPIPWEASRSGPPSLWS